MADPKNHLFELEGSTGSRTEDIMAIVKDITCSKEQKDALLGYIDAEKSDRQQRLTDRMGWKKKPHSTACRKPAAYDHSTMDVEHFMVVFNRYVTDLCLSEEEKVTALLTFLSANTLKKVLQSAPQLGEGCEFGDWHDYVAKFIQVIESLQREQALTARMSLKSMVQKTGETLCEFAEALTEIAEKGWARAQSARELVLKQALTNGAKNYWVRVWLIQNQEKYAFRELVAEANAVEVSHQVQEGTKGVEVSVLRAQTSEPLQASTHPPSHHLQGASDLSQNQVQQPPLLNHPPDGFYVPVTREQQWPGPPTDHFYSWGPNSQFVGQKWGGIHPPGAQGYPMEPRRPPWGGQAQRNAHIMCYNCQQMGHYSRECPFPRQQRNRGGQQRNQQYGRSGQYGMNSQQRGQYSLGYAPYNDSYDPTNGQHHVNFAADFGPTPHPITQCASPYPTQSPYQNEKN